MTNKQSFFIFCKTRVDIRGCNPTKEQLDAVFAATNAEAADMVAKWPGAIVKGSPAKPTQDWQAIYNEARQAGLAAGKACVPVPMVVQQHANPLDDNSPVVKTYAPIADGVCGFASVIISDGRSSFAAWLRKNKLGDKHYYGGTSIWVSDFGRSMTRKEAYADAFAAVLNKHGIKSYTTSRMD